jgi:hypothetical protein
MGSGASRILLQSAPGISWRNQFIGNLWGGQCWRSDSPQSVPSNVHWSGVSDLTMGTYCDAGNSTGGALSPARRARINTGANKLPSPDSRLVGHPPRGFSRSLRCTAPASAGPAPPASGISAGSRTAASSSPSPGALRTPEPLLGRSSPRHGRPDESADTAPPCTSPQPSIRLPARSKGFRPVHFSTATVDSPGRFTGTVFHRRLHLAGSVP